jgi:isoamylase
MEKYSMTLMQLMNRQLVTWHGIKLFSPDWSEDSHSLAFTVRSLSGSMDMHFMVNAYWDELVFEVPENIDNRSCRWKVWIDTSAESPADIRELNDTPELYGNTYKLCSHSLVVLIDLSDYRTEEILHAGVQS